jgi:hypothetical protein
VSRQLLECLEGVGSAPKASEWSPPSLLKILSTRSGLKGSMPVLSHPELMLASVKALSKAE